MAVGTGGEGYVNGKSSKPLGSWVVLMVFCLVVFAFCLSVVSVLSVVSRYCSVLRKRNIQFSISSGNPADKAPPLCSSALPLTSTFLFRTPFLVLFAHSSVPLCPFAKRLLQNIPSPFLDNSPASLLHCKPGFAHQPQGQTSWIPASWA